MTFASSDNRRLEIVRSSDTASTRTQVDTTEFNGCNRLQQLRALFQISRFGCAVNTAVCARNVFAVHDRRDDSRAPTTRLVGEFSVATCALTLP